MGPPIRHCSRPSWPALRELRFVVCPHLARYGPPGGLLKARARIKLQMMGLETGALMTLLVDVYAVAIGGYYQWLSGQCFEDRLSIGPVPCAADYSFSPGHHLLFTDLERCDVDSGGTAPEVSVEITGERDGGSWRARQQACCQCRCLVGWIEIDNRGVHHVVLTSRSRLAVHLEIDTLVTSDLWFRWAFGVPGFVVDYARGFPRGGRGTVATYARGDCRLTRRIGGKPPRLDDRTSEVDA
jgi:hypothetical protein